MRSFNAEADDFARPIPFRIWQSNGYQIRSVADMCGEPNPNIYHGISENVIIWHSFSAEEKSSSEIIHIQFLF